MKPNRDTKCATSSSVLDPLAAAGHWWIFRYSVVWGYYHACFGGGFCTVIKTTHPRPFKGRCRIGSEFIRIMVLATTFIGALDYLGGPNDYAVGDFNNDGLLDVLFTGGSWDPVADQPADRSNPINFLMAQGGGSFSLETRPDLGASIWTVDADVADFNGDGIDDAVFYDQGLDRDPFPGAPNTVVFGSDTGPVSTDIPTFSDTTHSGAVGDVDNDGDIDIVVINIFQTGGALFPEEQGSPGSYILLNDGAGNFTVDQGGLAGALPAPYWWDADRIAKGHD